MTGVYYRRDDYAGFWRRLLVDVVDLVAFGVLWAVLDVPIAVILPANRATMNLFLLASLAAGFLYFVILKRSRFRTLGYRAGRVKVVGLDGQVPTYVTLSVRSLFAILGPLDLIWLSNDKHRQTLRDKFAGTYVVKIHAQPAGEGKIVLRLYEIALYNCMFREVEVTVEQPPTASSAAFRSTSL